MKKNIFVSLCAIGIFSCATNAFALTDHFANPVQVSATVVEKNVISLTAVKDALSMDVGYMKSGADISTFNAKATKAGTIVFSFPDSAEADKTTVKFASGADTILAQMQDSSGAPLATTDVANWYSNAEQQAEEANVYIRSIDTAPPLPGVYTARLSATMLSN